MSRLASTVLAAALVCASSIARADDAAATAADALFEEGKALVHAGNWPDACAKFQASMDLDPAVGTLLKIAKCHEHDGKLTIALRDYKGALALNRTKPNQTEQRRAELDEFTAAAIAQLEPRIPKLRVVIAARPPGLRVTVGGEEIALAALDQPLSVDPGSIDVVADAPRYQTVRRTIAVVETSTTEVALALSPVVERASPPSEPSSTSSGTRRTVGFLVGGIGVVGLGIAGWFGLQTAARVNDASATGSCDPSFGRCTQRGADFLGDARVDQTAAFVSLAISAAALGAGIYLVATSPRQSAPPSTSASFGIGVGPSGAFVRGIF